MKEKVVVIGASGMLGHVLCEYLDNLNYDVYGFSRTKNTKYIKEELDFKNFTLLEEKIKKIMPNYIINCAGILVKKSNDDILEAIMINSYLPNFLDRLAKELSSFFITVSTDCVFSGKAGNYSEESFKDASDNYAKTKSLGETINNYSLCIRTSIIGPEIKKNASGLLDWFLNSKDSVNGYINAYWSGVTTLELSKQIEKLMKLKLVGLIHITSKEKISKYNLLLLFKEVFSKKIDIIKYENKFIDKSLISIRDDFNSNVPSYKSMLEDLKNWMKDKDYYGYK